MLSLSTFMIVLITRPTLWIGSIFLFIALNCIYFTFFRVEYLPFIKQISSVILGSSILVFLPLQNDWAEIKRIFKFTQLSLLPALILFFLDWNHVPFRLQGTFSEPSHLGDFLIMLLIPCSTFLYLETKKKQYVFVVGIGVIAGILTFSTLTIARLLILAISLLMLHFSIKRAIIASGSFIALISGFLFSGPNHVQYGLMRVLDLLRSGELPYNFASLVDRVYPVIYGFKAISSGYIFGLGPGSDWYAKSIIFDEAFLTLILPFKNSTSIANSFMGKMVIYWGIIPIMLLGLWGAYIYRRYDKTISEERILLAISISTIINSFFGLGNFSFPYVWFWLGISLAYYKQSAPLEEKLL